MRKRTTLAGAASAAITVVLALGTSAARADNPMLISVLRCAGDGGSTTVPAGQPVTLHVGGFAVGTSGLMKNVLHSQTTTLQVGQTTYDLSRLWSTPAYDPTFNFWVTAQPDQPLGTLVAGQTVVVTYDISFSHPVAILFPPVGSSGFNGPFVITEDGPFTCAIIAT